VSTSCAHQTSVLYPPGFTRNAMRSPMSWGAQPALRPRSWTTERGAANATKATAASHSWSDCRYGTQTGRQELLPCRRSGGNGKKPID